jgi:hypothetical protein
MITRDIFVVVPQLSREMINFCRKMKSTAANFNISKIKSESKRTMGAAVKLPLRVNQAADPEVRLGSAARPRSRCVGMSKQKDFTKSLAREPISSGGDPATSWG